MEGAAVKFALGKLNVLLKMGLELYHASDEVTHIQLALRMIEGFLEDANSKRNRNPAIKRWVNEVREVAYRIEDAIDNFLVDIGGNSAEIFGISSKFIMLLKPFKVKKFVDEVKAIRSTLETISQLRIQLEITDACGSSPQFDGAIFRPTGPSDIDDSEVVGLDRDKREILNQLLDTNISRRAVLSIVGMGGLGKTTLAQKVYRR
ncbi:Disease resistance protein (CC-NBS-LRR class) family [Rhynchospora pubera]|uniref:Disease resistance protein (CC-NBS-LRR class) family n=1 Tax=Rhynchospora pubera TaxID=906938 RepID=A0AAV8GWH1_9POAL|nr:Disease resistance protein (CC-NBS-LRR class) family [Rhynchospora pubera]